MQPDFKLCGQILKKLKDAERLAGPNAIVKIDGVAYATVAEQMQLLYEADLVSAITTEGRRTLTIAGNRLLRDWILPDCWVKKDRFDWGLTEEEMLRCFWIGFTSGLS